MLFPAKARSASMAGSLGAGVLELPGSHPWNMMCNRAALDSRRYGCWVPGSVELWVLEQILGICSCESFLKPRHISLNHLLNCVHFQPAVGKNPLCVVLDRKS